MKRFGDWLHNNRNILNTIELKMAKMANFMRIFILLQLNSFRKRKDYMAQAPILSVFEQEAYVLFGAFHMQMLLEVHLRCQGSGEPEVTGSVELGLCLS
jgi:hypothetical protein